MSVVNSKAQQSGNSNKTDTIIFGSGCFWCSEAIFQMVDGVIKVTPGYSGGNMPNPTYEMVCTGKTGYAEVIQVIYNPTIISFKELLEIFWQTHDPTTLNQQGADMGTQYRSVIFYSDQEQKVTAELFKSKLNESHIWINPIVTEINPVKNFYPAEEYHNDYYNRNKDNSYCSYVITPKIRKFEKLFSDQIRK